MAAVCFALGGIMTKTYETIKLDKLKPYANNPRNNDNAVPAVKASIQQVGYITPIVVDENYEILAGHTRAKALEKMGADEAQVLVVNGLTDEEKRKYRLLDNKTSENATWDFDMLAVELEGLDFEDFDFEFELPEDEEKPIKEVEYVEKISVVIDCEDDEEAETIFNKLTEEGYSCRISTL